MVDFMTSKSPSNYEENFLDLGSGATTNYSTPNYSAKGGSNYNSQNKQKNAWKDAESGNIMLLQRAIWHENSAK